ncbi:anti-sigma factor domain-containing protein [Microbacterium sp.]|uniref:anti-sigma factor n=1 Tax=Microbacterium sp. TaxID=51671 RepID=UPI003F6ED451
MNLDEFAELSAGHALGALSPADRAAFEAARAEHPEWSDIVTMDAATVASLADSVALVAPPLTMRGTLLSQLAFTPQDAAEAPVAPIVPPLPPLPRDVVLVETQPIETVGDADLLAPPADEPPHEQGANVEPAPNTAMIQAVSRSNWTRGLLGLAASLVLLVTIGFGAASLGQWLSRPPAVIALQEIEAAPDALSASAEVTGGGTATAHWSESLGKAVIVTDGLPSIATDKTFEMWFVRADGTPVSAGTFDARSATTELDGALQEGDAIAITVEPAGGSTSGKPSTEPIVAIPTA